MDAKALSFDEEDYETAKNCSCVCRFDDSVVGQ